MTSRGDFHSGGLIGKLSYLRLWEAAMRALIEAEPLARIDYVSAVDGETVASVKEISDRTLAALAVHIGKTRLIDNFTVHTC